MKFLLLLLLSTTAFGATCKKLSECLDAGHAITGQKYIYDKKIVPFTFELNQPIELNRNNVDKNLSEALALFGLVRIPTQIEKTSKIIEARDMKFQNDLPTLRGSKNALPKIPDSKDPLTVIYKAVKGADVEVIAAVVEPLLSRYGKVDPLRDGSLVLTDTANSLNKILPILEKQDFPLTGEEKAKLELQKKREHELELARLKSGELHEIGPHKHKD